MRLLRLFAADLNGPLCYPQIALINADFICRNLLLYSVRKEVFGEGKLIVRPATMNTPSP